MKSLMLLYQWLLFDLGARCYTSTTMDLKKIRGRTEHEGLSFCTIALPDFGKAFERALDRGYVDRQDFPGFAWRSGLPRFLSGFLCQVFDPTSGRLLNQPSIEAIQAVRQITLFAGKMFELPTKEREYAALLGYVECEQDVRRSLPSQEGRRDSRRAFQRMAGLLLGRVLTATEESLEWDFPRVPGVARRPGRSSAEGVLHPDRPRILPSHGPGATADGLKGNRKWQHNTWTVRLDEVFSIADFMLANYSFLEELAEVDVLEPESEIPVKVVSVPKTQKTPRIIAQEPTVMMFMQKGIQKLLYEKVERDNLLKAFIGFKDQVPNQELAREGSLTGELATLDLSDASDRVSCLHVEDLCHGHPFLLRALMAVRSTKADVQGIGVIPLSKYASMGSALTFPLEAMVFLTLCFLGIEKELKRPLTPRDFHRYVGKVRVFGDDIIVPVDCVNSVIEVLESFGMKVNRHKSFWTGKFRESCGREYYDGEDVSIVRVRQHAPESPRDAQAVVSWVKMSNQLYRAGLWRSVKWLDSFMSGILQDYPVVDESSPVLGRFSFQGYETQRMCKRLHRPLVKGWMERSDIPSNSLGGHNALLKWFSLKVGNLPIADEEHLERSGRPSVVNIKRGWGKPY
uniref:RNA-directed RNA polymerase n=1 Tax=Leviviridae sp. TaxID=2027243 RepID=A0A514DC78_9VIRU|nr:MAG: RNA-dependent RNA polymerase [Leviviridae sp.]